MQEQEKLVDLFNLKKIWTSSLSFALSLAWVSGYEEHRNLGGSVFCIPVTAFLWEAVNAISSDRFLWEFNKKHWWAQNRL